ncbi:MAG: glycosyltransferase family 4 protein [Clostridiales bacterium]|nr:glycosyltransferase family 4 protein [Clostridiales bacterium]
MKVAFLAEHFLLDPGIMVNGTIVQLYNLAVGFAQRGIKVHYICTTENKKGPKQDASGISLHWLKLRKGPFAWISNLRFYYDKLNRINPDAIYQRGRSYLTYVAAMWARKNAKIFVWASNGEDGCDFWKNTKRLIRSKSALWKKIVLIPNALLQDVLIHKGIRGATFIVNQTKNQKRRLWRNFHKNGIIIPSYFHARAKESDPQKKEKIVLWLANLSPGKQPEVFLRFAECCQDCEDWKFVLAGGTENKVYLYQVSRRANALPNLEMCGPVPFDESNRFFSRASLFVNTSIMEAEGLPNTFIQAWLSGTPVLSLTHDPNGWINKHNLGFCAEGNLNLFLEKGKALLKAESMLFSMGENCRKFALDTFATESVIDRYIELF